MEQNHRFRNSDTTLVAYLVTVGYPVLRVELDPETQRVYFVVDAAKDDTKIAEFIGKYYASQAKVEPAEFSQNYRNLVTMTRQARNG